MAFPFTIFLWFYLVAAFIVVLFGLSSLYHLLKFGLLSTTSVTTTFILVAGMVTILFVSYKLISPFDWSQSLDALDFITQLKPF